MDNYSRTHICTHHRCTKYRCKVGEGFTLLEMLIVVGIMAMFYVLMVANFGNWRGPQNLRIAQSELSTNLQKARTFALAGRRINDNTAKFYIVKLDKTDDRKYAVQGIAVDTASGYDVVFDGGPGHSPNIENIALPNGVYIKSFKYFQDNVAKPDPTCVDVAFSLPYGRTYITPTCTLQDLGVYDTPSTLSTFTNATLEIHLGRLDDPEERIVTVHGVSGRVE